MTSGAGGGAAVVHARDAPFMPLGKLKRAPTNTGLKTRHYRRKMHVERWEVES